MHRDLNMSTKHVHVYYLLNMLFMLRPILFTIIKPSDPLIDTLYQLQKKKIQCSHHLYRGYIVSTIASNPGNQVDTLFQPLSDQRNPFLAK